jgi:hypothetical protein
MTTSNAGIEHIEGWTIEYREHGGVWLTHPDGTRFGNWADPVVPAAVRRLARQHR